jgi:sec-independent protein translocase protein TatB
MPAGVRSAALAGRLNHRIQAMFNLSGSEIVIILLLALVVLGPEKLPDFLRRAGRTYAELKKLGNNFQSEMRSVLDEPMKEMRETADLLQKSTQLEDHEPSEPGSGGRATPAPARPAAPRPSESSSTAAPPSPAPDGDAEVATDANTTADEDLINRTLSGTSDEAAPDDDRAG